MRRVDQYHVILCSVGRRLLLGVDCGGIWIDDWVMILRGIICEKLLISASDIWMTLRHLYTTETQVGVVTLLHAEWLMSSNTGLLLY